MLASAAVLAGVLVVAQAVAGDAMGPVGPVGPVARLEAVSSDEGTESDEEDSETDDALSRFRTPFGVLVERTIGTSSRPVEYNWRRSTVQVAATGDHLFELNNFNSLRAGGMARFPAGGAIMELGLSYVWVWDTPSSELLAFTPYRQPGRPARLELDLTLGVPLAEGIVTASPRFFPAVEMVFAGYAGLRYLIYPGGFEGMRAREVASASASPMLTEAELANLEDKRLDAMQVDTGRYGLMLGVGDDLYFSQGVFIAPRLMMAVPVLALASQTQLLFWADLSITVGVAF